MKYLLVGCLLLCYACKPKHQASNTETYFPVFDSVITPDNWKICWVTNADSTDLWIKLTKNNQTIQFIDSQALTLRKDFIPYYKTETPFAIYMPYRCANNCEGMLVFSKQALNFKLVAHVAGYDTLTNKLVNIHDDSYAESSGYFKITITDVKTLRDTNLVFKNLALGSCKDSYIGRIQFLPSQTIVTATLYDKRDFYRARMITERKKVRF